MKILARVSFALIRITIMAIAMIPVLAITWISGMWFASLDLTFYGFLASMMIPGIISLAIGGSCYYLLMRVVARAIRKH